MKLFFKHLLRGIQKRPLQPTIIILTISLSILVAICAFTVKSSVGEEIKSSTEAKYGSSDLVLQLNSNSKSRFMLDSEAEKILGGDAKCAGTYELVLSLDDDTVFAKAVDFYKIGALFDFHFTEYGEIKESELSSSLAITEKLARTHGIRLNDKIELEIFGKRAEYRVCAISKSPFFDNSDIMVDISGVMEILASESLFVSILDNIKPYSMVYIDVAEDAKTEEIISRLRESEMFSDKTVVEVSQSVNSGIVEVSLPLIINLSIILCCFLTSVVVFNSIFILSKQRIEENESFIAAGTKKRTLNLLQYSEIFIYWLIGTPIGIFASLPALFLSERYLSFKYAAHALTAQNAVYAALLTLAVSAVTVTVFVLSRGEAKKAPKMGIPTIVLASLISLALAVSLASHGIARIVFGVLTVLLLLGFVFFATPYLISKLLELIFKIKEKKKRASKIRFVSLHYALKSIKNIAVLKNTSRFIASLVLVVLSVSVLVGAAHGNLNATREFFDGDFIILNATERCYDEIKDLESAESVSRVYQSRATYESGYLTLITSTDNKSAFGKSFEIKELPKGNEAILSKTDATTLNVGIGDEFAVNIEGVSEKLLVKDIVDTGTIAVIIDSTHFSLPPNMLLVKAKDGHESELLAALTLASSNELATVISAEKLRADKIESNTSLLRCATMLLLIIAVYSLLGIFNNLFESYRARREELMLYHYAGISKSQIATMILCELGAVFLFGVTLGLVATFACVLAMNQAFSPLSFEVISYLKFLF